MSLFFVFKTTIKTYEQCFIIQYLTIPPPLSNHETKYLKTVYVKKCQLVFWRIQVSTPSLGKQQSINQSINQVSNSTGGLINSPINHSKYIEKEHYQQIWPFCSILEFGVCPISQYSL